MSTVSDSSSTASEFCSLCIEETKEQTGSETPTADTYCVDCKYKLCEECCIEHRKFKATKNHKLMPITEYESSQNVTTNLIPVVCVFHEQKVLDVYCTDCKTVLCAICFIEEHSHHKGAHVKRCVDGFRKQIESNTEAMQRCIAQAQMKKAEIGKAKEEMHQRVENLEYDVEKRKEEIKIFADKHASCLLQDLCCERESRLKEIQMATDDTDAYIFNLESYNSYCQRILDKGSASDICNALSDLSVRAFELQQACRPVIEREIPNFRFCFSHSELEEFLTEDGGNLVGEIHEEGNMKSKKGSRQNLLAELTKENDLLKKEIEDVRTEKLRIEQQIIIANEEAQALREELMKEKVNYNNHAEKLKQELDNNALQLNNDKLKQKLDAEKTTNNSLQVNNDKLQEATLKTVETNTEKLVKKPGELRYRSDPVLVQTIRTKAAEENKKAIRGLTILDNELVVVHGGSSEVEVYDSINFSFSRRWKLKELIDPWDIASCRGNKCLYISDDKDCGDKTKAILRVDLNGNLIKNWSTGFAYNCRLSVTVELTVILASYSQNDLKEYSPDGLLIREIDLSTAGIRHPWHAIKLTNGHFVVSHGSIGDDLHRVCEVDSDGKLKKSFGGKRGRTMGQLNSPVHFSVDRNGFVLVAGERNRRVLLLDSDLKFKREIHSKEEKYGLRLPWRILLDESNRRLFVADNQWSNQRILIFDL